MSADLGLPTRLLMGSGPTNPDPRVLRAMATPLVGQFDPAFTALMGETQELLRRVFRTRNRATFPVPGTSRAGLLEAHGIEIMGAVGTPAGRVWRIGTMAGNARREPVARTLTALAESLGERARAARRDALASADERVAALDRAATAA